MPKTPIEVQPDSTEIPASAAHTRSAAMTTMSPEAWSEVFFRPSPSGRLNEDGWKHAAATSLHGWGAYHQRTGIAFALTAEDYLAAIDAASGSTFTAHPAADCREKG